MFKFLLASAATVYASADVGIPPGIFDDSNDYHLDKL